METLKDLYELFGTKYPLGSYVAAGLIGACVCLTVWWYIGTQYRKDHPNANDNPLPNADTGSIPKPRIEADSHTGSKSAQSAFRQTQSTVVISIRDSNGLALRGVHVILVSPNGTHAPIALTNAEGTATLPKPASDLVDVYCARNDLPAYYKSGHDPVKPLQITLSQKPGLGSLIQAGEGYVQIPGLNGGLDPRTYPSTYPNAGEHYLYVRNLSVNGHVESLFPFNIGQSLSLEDNEGHRVELELIAANAECFLMQYKKP